MDIRSELFEMRDEGYASFQSKLTPTVPLESVIGVRVPELRKLAKKLIKDGAHVDFMESLPHEYYDENMLHALLISEIKDYDFCLLEIDKFLPYVDNWAVCDVMSPKVFKKHRASLIEKIKCWIDQDSEYICRFGIEMLMSHFLDDDFKPEYTELVAGVRSNDYYVKMMVAWFFATALAKQWDFAVAYIENRALSEWEHNKTIQKACESFRITSDQKAYLRTLKK